MKSDSQLSQGLQSPSESSQLCKTGPQQNPSGAGDAAAPHTSKCGFDLVETGFVFAGDSSEMDPLDRSFGQESRLQLTKDGWHDPDAASDSGRSQSDGLLCEDLKETRPPALVRTPVRAVRRVTSVHHME